MRIKAAHILLFLALGVLLLNSACKKDKTLTTGGQLNFSTDTLTFDTVFTAAGSFTTSLKIYNPQSQAVEVSSIRLARGNGSYFHLNIDGFPGNSHDNLKIAAHDSIYVFATVNIDPTDANTPFIVTDSLIATLNGNNFVLPFMAYGQNAHYITDSVMPSQTWINDKPYVIVHSAAVDAGQTLTINKGCRIYMHQDSRLVVLGTLNAIGTKTDSIVFQGDRLDRAYFGYQGYPGEWGGIYFDSHSKNSKLDYVQLLNCGNSALNAPPAAIEVYIDSNFNPLDTQLVMRHTIIQNSIGYGILSFGGSLKAENCLVNACGAQAFAALQGGNYWLDNCTFALYNTDKVSHTNNSTAAFLNYYAVDDTHYIPGALNAVVRNCIIWGSLDNELQCDKVNDANASVLFDHCIIKSANALPSWVQVQSGLINQDPQFKNYQDYDFHLNANSPAIGTGINIPAITDDLDGNPRNGATDIGCYQHQ